MSRPRSRSERLYDKLLLLYPRIFRDRFGEGMAFTFASEAREAGQRGSPWVFWLWIRTVAHVVFYAAIERLPGGRGDGKWKHGLGRDLMHGARRLRRSPGFTIAAAVTLALGVGATTAMFTLVKSVVFNPLPYPEADRLVALQHSAEGAGLPLMGVSLGTYDHYREFSRSFEEMTAFRPQSVAILGDAGAQRVPGAVVTQGFFELLLDGTPALGRTISEADQAPGAPRVVVLSYDLWRSRYGGDPTVLGRSLSVDGAPAEVVGVLPASFDVPSDQTQLWLPERLDPREVILGGFGRSGIGLLRAGVTIEQAQLDLERLVPTLADRFNPVAFDLLVTGGGLTPLVRPLKDTVVGSIEETLWILLATVLFVLGIACANVANLFLVRAEAQRREVAVRSALGAGRAALLRHHLSESLLLGLLGGVGGLLITMVALRWLVSWGPASVPRLHEVGVDASALVVATGLSIAAGVLFGLIPFVRRSRSTSSNPLTDASRGNTAGKDVNRMRSTLVVVQVAMALILLVGAGLMVRTFWHLRGVEPGFDAPSALVFQVGLPRGLYPDREEAFRFQQSMIERVSALPGVSVVGASVCLPLDNCSNETPVYAADAPVIAGQTPPSVDVRGTTAGYFEALGIPVIEGRDFTASDPYQEPVALVSQNAAARLWPGESAVGKQIYPDYPEEEPFTVVGVVGNVLDQGLTRDPPEMLYLSFLGSYGYTAPPHTLSFVVRTSVPPLAVAPSVRTAVQELDPNVPLANMRTMEDLVSRASAPTAFAMILLVGAGVVALILGSVGVYGVLSYVVSQRTGEIGVRMAMGAEAAQVRRMVLSQGVRVAAVGVAVGLAGALALTRLMSAVLHGVSPIDGPTYVAVTIALAVVAMLASYLPARRAAAVDPIDALRSA